ncbi:MAG: hypothetical protein HYZ65_08660 [Burkholderiales bacterium]|nr:hypothetical protein [Burkholderiales bacterium]
MTHNYTQLARKLNLLARPRLRVSGTPDALRVELLQNPAGTGVLVAYEFTCTVPGYDLDRAENIQALSDFLEIAALQLETRSSEENPSSFAQHLYNQGFWQHAAGASKWLSCEIAALEYDRKLWH